MQITISHAGQASRISSSPSADARPGNTVIVDVVIVDRILHEILKNSSHVRS